MAYKCMMIVLLMMMIDNIATALPPNEEILSMDHLVGDDKGWSIGVDYAAWVQSQQFQVGDKLVFEYQRGDHNVIEVDEAGYNDCVAPSTARILESGKDTISLSSPGTKWFICGVSIHCSGANQKLKINVVAVGSQSPAGYSGTSSYASGSAKSVAFNSYIAFVYASMLVAFFLAAV